MKISELEGKRLAIWGYGREGRAALAALRWRLPGQPITVFCNEPEAEALRAMGDPHLVMETEVDGQKLAAFDVVVKSPGISPYTSPAVDLMQMVGKYMFSGGGNEETAAPAGE